MSQDSKDSPLDLPHLEEVERALGLDEEDRRGDLPGLHRLNAEQAPRIRIAGIQILLAVAALHNLVVFQGLGWGAFLAVAAGMELYAFGAYWILRRYFARAPHLHLGTVFMVADIGVFALAVWATGAHRSWLWPVFVVRVADQMWTGRRRAAAMAVLSVGAYAGLLGLMALAGHAIPWDAEALKLLILATLSLYLILASGLPWDLQTRTQRAKDLILQLEDQSAELDGQRRKAEAASLAKGQFLSRMSHELRTPMNSILGFTHVLLREKTGEEHARERNFLGRIRDNGMHLLALINDILDLTQIQDGKMEVQAVSVDLGALIRSTVAQLESRTVNSPLRLAVAIPEGLEPLQADEARTRQVLINLVGNAIKFTEEGSVEVRVKADDEGRPLSVAVRDTGIGIPEDRIEGVFDAFEQAEGDYARRYEGTGLGLAISRSLCRLMGFDLTVESQEGKGSTFTVHFDEEAA